MKVILLTGKPNTGKTTTLNGVYDELVNNRMAKIHTAKKQVGSSPRDFECILDYQNKLVAIYTAGDIKEKCYQAIIQYASVDVLILAYSERFANSISSFVSQFPYHAVVNKTVSSNNNSINADNQTDINSIRDLCTNQRPSLATNFKLN